MVSNLLAVDFWFSNKIFKLEFILSKFELDTEEGIVFEVVLGGKLNPDGLIVLEELADARDSSDKVVADSAAISCIILFSDSSKFTLEAPAAAFEAEPPYRVWRSVSSAFLADIKF